MLSMPNNISHIVSYNTKGKDEARSTAHKSRGIPDLLFDGHKVPSGFRKTQTREEKDFLSSNVRRMRQVQREHQYKERAKTPETPIKDLWKSAKFKDTKSRFKTGQEEGINGYTLRPSTSHEYLKGHSRPNTSDGRPRSAIGGAKRPRSAVGGALPRKSASDSLIHKAVQRLCLDDDNDDVILEKPEIDYVNLNGRLAKHSVVQRSASVLALDELKKSRENKQHNYQRGIVPKYLKSRQQGWQNDEQERIRNTPDPDLPEGHRKLPESERVDTLSKLQESEKLLLEKMQALPICGQTFRVKQQREMLNQKLTEISEAVKIFSRVKVFVKLDETPRP